MNVHCWCSCSIELPLFMKRFTPLLVVVLTCVVSHAATNVDVALKPGGKWTSYPTRTFADLPTVVQAGKDSNLSRYGGTLDRKVATTGFFYPTNVDGRW